jgi:hypothetical protein
VYARLNPDYGWRWINEKGIWGLFILSKIYRNAGMVSGIAPNGRFCTRPLWEYDLLSMDGAEWLPFEDLRAQIPWDKYTKEEVVALPDKPL